MSCCKHSVDDKKEDLLAVRNDNKQLVLSESAMGSGCLDGLVAGGYKLVVLRESVMEAASLLLVATSSCMSRTWETFVQVWILLS